MADFASLLRESLDAWQYAREGFIAEAENVPAEQWGFRPTPENRDVTELVRHILEAAAMAVGELTDHAGDFTRRSFAEHIRTHAGDLPEEAPPDRWLELLRRQLDDGTRRIRDFGAAGMVRSIRQFNGEPATRLTWFNHHIAHEEYHRGQLALYGRLTGHVPALTQRISGG